jgi:hypothetical protein
MLPNLIIIGAPKAGTTALHQYLGHHPEIFMSRQKELQLFQRDDWRDQLAWYESQFPPCNALVRGEGSPVYTLYPFCRDVPCRMRELVPDAKLIYLVRDPVERFIAHYVEHYSLGFETRPFADVAADLRPGNQVLAGSRYATQLEKYLECFPRSQILVVDQDEMRARRRETLSRVFGFLGVDSGFWSPEFEALHNQRKQVRYNGFARWLYRHGLFDSAQRAGRGVPAPLRRAARRTLGPTISRPVLDGKLREGVVADLAGEAERFRALTGCRFESWSV